MDLSITNSIGISYSVQQYCRYEITFLGRIYFLSDNLLSHFVVYYRQSNNDSYDRAIQYQCKFDESGERIFTDINFISRTHLNSDDQRKQTIEKMTLEAIKAGVEQQYLQQLKIVQWLTC